MSFFVVFRTGLHYNDMYIGAQYETSEYCKLISKNVFILLLVDEWSFVHLVI